MGWYLQNCYHRIRKEIYLMQTPNSKDIIRATIQDMYRDAEAEQRQIELDYEMNRHYNDDFYRQMLEQLKKDKDENLS